MRNTSTRAEHRGPPLSPRRCYLRVDVRHCAIFVMCLLETKSFGHISFQEHQKNSNDQVCHKLYLCDIITTLTHGLVAQSMLAWALDASQLLFDKQGANWSVYAHPVIPGPLHALPRYRIRQLIHRLQLLQEFTQSALRDKSSSSQVCQVHLLQSKARFAKVCYKTGLQLDMLPQSCCARKLGW